MRNTFKKISYLATRHKAEIFLCLFILLAPLFIFIANTIVTYVDKNTLTKKVSSIESSFDQELKVTLEKTKQATGEGEINKYIASNDVTNVSEFLRELATKYHFSGMVAVNKEGVALARLASSKTGDYVAQTTLWGRRAAQGESVVTIGIGRSLPLLINAAVPIIEDGEVQGALYGAQILNNAYAIDFKKKYLREEEEMAFYSKEIGIYGNSFENPEIQPILKSYFNNGTFWVQSGRSELGVVRFRLDGKVYHIGNIPLHDIEGNFVGGMLIFFPVNPYLSHTPNGIIALIIFIWLIIHVFRRHKNNKLYQIGVPIIFLLVLLGCLIVYIRYIGQYEYSINKLPYTIYNSTIALSPETDLFNKTTEQKLTIQITTGGESINAAEAHLTYDPKLVRIEDILMINSFCDPGFIIEKSIDNIKGEVAITCGKTNGFVGDVAVLAELLTQPVKEGELTMQFGNDTQVLANDGLGTNVLRSVINGSYQIVDTNIQQSESKKILLFSDTHPNSTRWYNQKNVHINWPKSNTYNDFLYAFDQNKDTVLDGTNHTTDTEINVTAKTDGIYYFHLAPKKQNYIGPVSHLKVMVDTTPPALSTIKVSEEKVKMGDVVRFEFSGNGDDQSGLQKNFYVRFDDDGVLFPVLPQLNIPFFETGTHRIILRVFDNAGNYSDSTKEIIVY